MRRQASLVLSYEGIPRAYVDYSVSSPWTLAYHVITGMAVAWHAPAVQGMQVHLPALLFLLSVSPCRLFHITPNVFIFGWHHPNGRMGRELLEGGMESPHVLYCSTAPLLGGSALCASQAIPRAALHPTHLYNSTGNLPC